MRLFCRHTCLANVGGFRIDLADVDDIPPFRL
jgi:hypothetical protein